MPKNRNGRGKITIYKGCKDKTHVLIHEIIHAYLFDRSKRGLGSRIMDKLNNNEKFVNGLAIEINTAIKENKINLSLTNETKHI